MKPTVRTFLCSLIAAWLATCGGLAFRPLALADDLVNQEDVFVQQIEQQYGPQLRQLHKAELHFMRIVCQPTREQFGKIAADGEPAIKAAMKKFAENMMPQKRVRHVASQPFDPRQSLAEALVAATGTNAKVLHLDRLGTLAAGKEASFNVLDANPLENITNTRRINRVYLRGVEVDRARLRRAWTDGTNR